MPSDETEGTESPGASADPGVVRVFDARVEQTKIALPIEILRASDLKIEIVELKFFGDAIGGAVEVQFEDSVRPGRIVGARIGGASAQECVDRLSEFLEYLRSLPSPTEAE